MMMEADQPLSRKTEPREMAQYLYSLGIKPTTLLSCHAHLEKLWGEDTWHDNGPDRTKQREEKAIRQKAARQAVEQHRATKHKDGAK
jgi:hypothetical protein